MVNIAVLGVGYWGPNTVRNLRSIDFCNLKYVCDLNEARLEFIRSAFPEQNVTNNYKELLNDKELDAVCIVTPVTSHEKLGLEFLNAGKHVFIEKPLTFKVSEAENLVAKAKEKNLVLCTGHIFQFSPAVQKAKELIESGFIGKINYVTASRMNQGAGKYEVDVSWDLATHDLSIINYLMEKVPNRVSAFGKNHTVDLNDTVTIRMDYRDNAYATIEVSWLSPFKFRLMRIFGSKGTLVYDEMAENKLVHYGLGIDDRDKGRGAGNLTYKEGEKNIVELPKGEPLKNELINFLQAINGTAKPVADGVSGLNVVKILSACAESMKNDGKWISIS
ncbi:Gfo/Idh/MocA family oxidoreductase [bacterium]|nr:Gfo/Idh/MocA family oxidoreductase [bacterium]